ncbi:HET-domain-containing protein, partial [Stipitochalara longipes BDJ]
MGEIRLLRIISAASNNCILRCELSTFQLRKENPDYVAVSYVWGDPSITEDIVINGRLVPVTKNLALALRQFRDGCPARDHASLLWADAICIDQSNAEEKTHQVRLMPIIYERAACVMSWLGPCREELYGAMKSIRRLYAKKLPDGSVGNRVWTEIDILMRNPYWSRSWIVQEM